jgi:diguanylate cyclase (GGDEF)-like protein/PAS domain S-box-containing protein
LITDVPAVLPQSRDRSLGELESAAFEELFLRAGGMLAVLDQEGRFLAVNPACGRALGVDPQSLVGQSLLDSVRPHDGLPGVGHADRQVRPGDAGKDRVVELLACQRHGDGTWRWLLWSGAAHGDRWYASARDVTEWIRLEDRVGRDPLTRLPNREVIHAELTHALSRHARSNRHLAVLFIDIDAFKQINDSIGHEAGDRLLAEVAERLREAVRGGDVVARLGGDEFVILAESLGHELDAAMVARRALAAFDRPLELGSGPITVSASIGVTTASGGRTAAALLHEADTAMYRAKAAGGNRFAMFDTALRNELEQRLGADDALRTALANEQFELYYQPVISLGDGGVVGCEALLRWIHPERGIVLPGDFVPLAEENGLIVPLGAWTLRSAAAQAAAWRIGGAELLVSVNVSARQLADEGFVGAVAGALAESGLSPDGLCLEIAESTVLVDPAKAAARVGELRELGVRIALDEFGAGFSSLRQLVHVPVDVIKLDRTFVNGLVGSDARTTRAFLIAVMAAARELAISVVAVGVDHERQLEELRDAGCDSAQGELFASALAPAEVSLERRRIGARQPAAPEGDGTGPGVKPVC